MPADGRQDCKDVHNRRTCTERSSDSAAAPGGSVCLVRLAPPGIIPHQLRVDDLTPDTTRQGRPCHNVEVCDGVGVSHSGWPVRDRLGRWP